MSVIIAEIKSTSVNANNVFATLLWRPVADVSCLKIYLGSVWFTRCVKAHQGVEIDAFGRV